MTWIEIQSGLEKAGINDSDDICAIQCDCENGDGSFHVVKLGRYLKLVEKQLDRCDDYSGCAI
jgi:hypothetical protein